MQRRTILTGTALGVAGAALGLTRSAEAAPGAVTGRPIAIRGVTVIDASVGVRRGYTVLIAGDRTAQPCIPA